MAREPIPFFVEARDWSGDRRGALVPGLSPTWVYFKRASDGATMKPAPPITDFGGGIYKFSLDVVAAGTCVGLIDLGATFGDHPSDPGDRYKLAVMYRANGLADSYFNTIFAGIGGNGPGKS
jgi:hypothetical protein